MPKELEMFDKKLIDELATKFATAYEKQKIIQNQEVILDMSEKSMASMIWAKWTGLPANANDHLPTLAEVLPEETRQKVGLVEDKRITGLSKPKQDALFVKCEERMLEIIESHKS